MQEIPLEIQKFKKYSGGSGSPNVHVLLFSKNVHVFMQDHLPVDNLTIFPASIDFKINAVACQLFQLLYLPLKTTETPF